MRVALYHPWLYLQGGAERTLLEYAKRSRHRVEFFTHHYDPHGTFPGYRKFKVHELRPKVSVERGYAHLARAAFRIARTPLPLEGFDALLVSTSGFGEFIALANRGRVPVVCFCHTPLRVIHEPQTRQRFLGEASLPQRVAFHAFERVYRALERNAWRSFARVLCNSGETKRRVAAAGLYPEERLQVLHPGVQLERFRGRPRWERFFLAPGRVMWQKNLELAIDAFRAFTQRWGGPPYRLVVAGSLDEKSKPYLRELREAAKGLAVDFVTDPTDARMAGLFLRCRAVLFTAISEDWGIVPLEGMAAGKPVLAVNEGGPREAVLEGVTGHLLPSEPEAFARKMLDLAEDPARARRFGAAGRAHAKRYSWQRFAERFDRVLEEVAR